MSNLIALNKITFNEVLIKKIARDSAEYLLNIFKADGDIDVLGVIGMIAQCCMNRNEVEAYVKILRYCRKKGFELPQYYNELAADSDSFDLYCRQLVYYMIELSR